MLAPSENRCPREVWHVHKFLYHVSGPQGQHGVRRTHPRTGLTHLAGWLPPFQGDLRGEGRVSVDGIPHPRRLC